MLWLILNLTFIAQEEVIVEAWCDASAIFHVRLLFHIVFVCWNLKLHSLFMQMGKESYCMVFLRNLCSLKTLHTNVWGIFLWMHLMSVALIATNVRKLYCIRTQTLNFDLWNTWSNSKRATCAAHIKHKHDKTWHFIGTTFKIKAILYCFKIVLILADLMRLTYSEQLYLALAQWITNLIYISAQRTYKKLSL